MLATQVIFATLPIAIKLVLPVVEPLGIVAIRIGGAAALFAAVKWNRTRQRVAPGDLLRFAGLALLGVVLNQILFLEGVRRTTAVHTNILITTIPVFTLGVALLLRRERASAAKLTGIALAGAGAAYLALSHGGAAEGASAQGDLLVAANSLCYASYLVLSKDLLRRYAPMTVVTWVFLIGAVLIAPLGVPALLRVNADAVSTRTVLVLVYIVVFPSFLTYLLSIWALRHTASSLVAMYVYVQPVVTAFLAPLILGETVTPRIGLASVLIFAGLALSTWGEQVTGGQLGRAFRPPAEGA
ncbi:MAG: DMT family transporter [Gemmatimonadales bacterium]